PPPSGSGNYGGQELVFSAGVLEDYEDDHAFTSPVKSYQSLSGLYDMGGNVSEWCQDWYSAEQKYRVVRGGSWGFQPPFELVSSRRGRLFPSSRNDTSGFRIVVVDN
ncbi:MAG: SUMF1/EgtB/PvdO family nonheme iron enzyme, partial [Verrucomicrobiota bacterium]